MLFCGTTLVYNRVIFIRAKNILKQTKTRQIEYNINIHNSEQTGMEKMKKRLFGVCVVLLLFLVIIQPVFASVDIVSEIEEDGSCVEIAIPNSFSHTDIIETETPSFSILQAL